MKQLDPNDTIALGFSVQYALDEGKGIAFQSCLDLECTAAQLNAALDKMVAAAERQQAKLRLPKLRGELARLEKTQARATEDMFRLDSEAELEEVNWQREFTESGRRGPFKLSAVQAQTKRNRDNSRENAKITFERLEEDIRLRKAEISELEAMVNAASSANDSFPSVQHS